MPWTSLSSDSDFAVPPSPSAHPAEGGTSFSYTSSQQVDSTTPTALAVPTPLVVMRITGQTRKPVAGRENESEEARARRIAADRERKRRQRNNETEETRLKRKLADKEHKRFIRGMETLEQRRARRLEQKVRRMQREREGVLGGSVEADELSVGGMGMGIGMGADKSNAMGSMGLLEPQNPETVAALNLLAVGRLDVPESLSRRHATRKPASDPIRPSNDSSGAAVSAAAISNEASRLVAELSRSVAAEADPEHAGDGLSTPAPTGAITARGVGASESDNTPPLVPSLGRLQAAYI